MSFVRKPIPSSVIEGAFAPVGTHPGVAIGGEIGVALRAAHAAAQAAAMAATGAATGPRLVTTPADPAAASYDTLDLRMDAAAETLWCHMNPPGRPSFTAPLLQDILRLQRGIRQRFAALAPGEAAPFRSFVMASKIPGIFNLGGDLAHFADRIRAGDRDSLARYAHSCVDAIHGNASAFDAPVMTVALVQGDALGGGFECALAFDIIVAERSAKFGLPEILFNLFPGMGAYSFLSRKIGPVQAERMITSGRIHTAEELHAMGVVDVLAEDGEGEQAVRDHLERLSRRHNAHRAIFQARRRVNPVTLDELRDVVEIWVDAALGLEEPDLRKMGRLAAAQDRRRAAATAG